MRDHSPIRYGAPANPEASVACSLTTPKTRLKMGVMQTGLSLEFKDGLEVEKELEEEEVAKVKELAFAEQVDHFLPQFPHSEL